MSEKLVAEQENKSMETYRKNSYERFVSYDRFRFLYDIMGWDLKGISYFLDIGCAKSEFIWTIKEEHPFC